MPDPKTPQELNEAVAKRLGFDFDYGHNGTIITTAYEKGYEVFRPATDPAAAVWALKILKEKRIIECAGISLGLDGKWGCTIVWAKSTSSSIVICDTPEEAISRAIAETAER